jgi:hypothetical protein
MDPRAEILEGEHAIGLGRNLRRMIQPSAAGRTLFI